MTTAASPARAAAAQRNGALSQGPATAQGKSHSSQNARKHNIFTSTGLLPHEEREEFAALAAELEEEHDPQTATERIYLAEMIDAMWRLRRTRQTACILQTRQMETLPPDMDPHDAAAEAFRQLADTSKSLELLRRYEAQFRRQFDNSLKLLLEHRRRRELDRETIARRPDEALCNALEAHIMAPVPNFAPPAAPQAPQNPQSPFCKNEPKPPATAFPGPISVATNPPPVIR